MSSLPYNPDAGNGIRHVDELYTYMEKCPLCVYDIPFMESYGRILCRAPWITHDYFMDAAITASNDMKEMGYDMTNEEIEERAINFNKYLQEFPEYDTQGCTSDADGNVIIHVLQEGGRWEPKYRGTPTF
jgi:hypothetical protein